MRASRGPNRKLDLDGSADSELSPDSDSYSAAYESPVRCDIELTQPWSDCAKFDPSSIALPEPESFEPGEYTDLSLDDAMRLITPPFRADLPDDDESDDNSMSRRNSIVNLNPQLLDGQLMEMEMGAERPHSRASSHMRGERPSRGIPHRRPRAEPHCGVRFVGAPDRRQRRADLPRRLGENLECQSTIDPKGKCCRSGA
jgi:hypothetical protein